MFCDPGIQKRIERVYPLDSPGFIGNTLESEEYGRIQSRVHKVIPKGSLIGCCSKTTVHTPLWKATKWALCSTTRSRGR